VKQLYWIDAGKGTNQLLFYYPIVPVAHFIPVPIQRWSGASCVYFCMCVYSARRPTEAAFYDVFIFTSRTTLKGVDGPIYILQ
jgi:hypothetical protein